MTDQLAVYAYNVLFGDGILIEVPDGQARRFILIDVGNALSGAGGEDQPLLDAIKDIRDRTHGRIDLYLMTHEHMDHVQGLLYAKEKGCELQIETTWMTASADPTYYQNHPEARRKRLELEQAVEAFWGVIGMSGLRTGLEAVQQVNASGTEKYVDFIRRASRRVHYLYRGCDIEGLHPFTETGFRILAPEEDTSVYYESVPHLAQPTGGMVTRRGRPMPLPGIDGSAFYDLIGRMDNGFSESLFAIDRAANNTSLVVELTWRGRRILLTGDAELKSWQAMANSALLKPADVVKIGHHGSRNATPPPTILDKVLPPERRGEAVAVLSTLPGVYSGVPDPRTLASIRERTTKIYSTTDVTPGKPVVVTLDEAR